MNRFSTLLALASVFCVSTTVSAQVCRDGNCSLHAAPRSNSVPAYNAPPKYNSSTRNTYSTYQRLTFGDCTTCADGNCCLDGQCRNCQNRNCQCDGKSCNCAPHLTQPQRNPNLENRPNSFEPLARTESQYRQTNFSAPGPQFNTQTLSLSRTVINWDNDFDRASQRAQQEHRPMLVRVTASWCGYCTKMKQETYTNNGIIRDIESTFVAIEVDADQNRKLVEQLGVQSLPATLVISPDMRIVDREQGFRSAEQLSSVLRRHLRRAELETNMKVALR